MRHWQEKDTKNIRNLKYQKNDTCIPVTTYKDILSI